VSATCTYYVGDALTVMRTLPAGSVDLVLSSPAFLGLRSYLPPDHPDKAKEMGSEETPGEFIDALLNVVEEAGRVLAPYGSLCLELGDTYAGSGGAGGDYAENGLREGQARFDGSGRQRRRMGNGRDWPQSPGANWKGERDGWPLDKSLCLVPELLRFALAYGLNPLTGRQTPRWRVRNVVRWCRPNPPVGALADKFRPATSEMVVACKSRSRYFDLDAVRGDPSEVKDQRVRTTNGPKNGADRSEVLTAGYTARVPSHPNGAPPLDWWQVSTEPYKGSHYATWPRGLLTRPILSMCPERVCIECGEPSWRIVGDAAYEGRKGAATHLHLRGTERHPDPQVKQRLGTTGDATVTRVTTTLGWTDCGHDAWRPGVVLDPFAGTGTTGLVATGHGRSAVLIDLDARNLDLARERIGMFLTEGVMEATA
jgi:site-specific DNA-methyltransferase (adenine-specific)